MLAPVEALLTAVAVLVVMALAFVLLARGWPRSSRRTGYRITGQDQSAGEAPPAPEDDDARWRWRR
jgi:hypothetical protein